MPTSKKRQDKIVNIPENAFTLVNVILHSFSNPVDRDLVKKAILYSFEHTGDVMRDSGEAFPMHSLRGDYNLLKIDSELERVNTMRTSIYDHVAEHVHDVPEEDGMNGKGYEARLDDIALTFNEGVAFRVDALRTIKREGGPRYGESFYRLVEAASEIPQVLLIKLAERMDNIETLWAKDPTKWVPIALDTRVHHIPTARYLGLNSLADYLEKWTDYYLPQDMNIEIKDEEIFKVLESAGIPKGIESYSIVKVA